MGRFFIVSEAFDYETRCSCSAGEYRNVFSFNKGDIIEFTGEHHVSPIHGLFYRIAINKSYMFYMTVEEIDQNFLSQRFVSINDLKFMIKQIKHYIDYSLDIGDKKLFLYYSEQLIEANTLIMNYENHLAVV